MVAWDGLLTKGWVMTRAITALSVYCLPLYCFITPLRLAFLTIAAAILARSGGRWRGTGY